MLTTTTAPLFPLTANIAKFSYLSVGASANSVVQFPTGVSFVFQTDGNFVAYKDGSPVAATASNSSGSNLFLVFQTDGNLVVYSGSTPLWATETGGVATGAYLVLQDKSPYIQIVGQDGSVYYTANEK